MACLKCGKETQENQVFCSECKSVMDQHPVKPGTPVQILPRQTAPVEKKSRRKLTPEQTIVQLRRVIRWLFAAALALLLIVCFLAFRLFGV